MPAFKYHTNYSVGMATQADAQKHPLVDVYLRDGRIRRVFWLGFIENAEELKPYHYRRFVKIRGISVTGGDGGATSKWSVLYEGQFIVGWLVPFNASHPGVYMVLEKNGVPAIRGILWEHRALEAVGY
jgi:hypothetical protein